MNLKRRSFIKLASTAVVGSLAAAHPLVVQAAAELPTQSVAYAGSDLDAWSIVVGDGVWNAADEAPVSDTDIETVHLGDYSEIRANIGVRHVEAHNITHQSVTDLNAMQYVHVLEYEFRLPYLPATEYTGLNAQTIEGGLGLWDGAGTRTKYGIGFQWGLNPYSGFGDVRTWTGRLGQGWQTVSYLEPDLAWHRLRIVADFLNDISSLTIDGQTLASCIGKCPAPDGWGDEVAVGPSAEVISIYPGEEGRGALHMGQFRNWAWVWEPQLNHRLFLPTIQR